jgi:two-component system response regulator PilR (NtrC family)
MVHNGTFREDLFYRLNVVHIVVPPLRERVDDIPLLAFAFMAKHAEESQKPLDGIAPEALRALGRYDFPGNVRELENYVERAVALANGPIIRLEDLPPEIQNAPPSLTADPAAFPNEGIALERTLADLERRFIEEALRRASGVKTHAAELLGLSFRSLRYRMHKLEMGDASEPGLSTDDQEEHEG